MRAILLALALVLTLNSAVRAAEAPPALVNAAGSLERTAIPALGAAHNFFDHATETHAAWVVMRDVATFRSQCATLVAVVGGENAHLVQARDLVSSLVVLSNRVDKLLTQPGLAPAEYTEALVRAMAKTKPELQRVILAMPPVTPPAPPAN